MDSNQHPVDRMVERPEDPAACALKGLGAYAA